ncbi:MAG TPA: hypothetical protein VJZ91_01675 [Blastocatellia bacterium]|nr:hypothetical protein [Blastocatellia bacterium]
MGRTVLPFSEVLAERQRQFSKFRRALRAEDQQALDALFEQARLHIQAAVYYADPEPAEAFFLSVLIETWKVMDDLQKRVSELEGRRANNGDTAA